MKRTIILSIICLLLFSLIGCAPRDSVIESLPSYTSKTFYTSGGFQDYTDFAIYTYASIDINTLEESNYFNEITADNFEEVFLHIDNFEHCVETIGGDLERNYSFESSVINEGDFYYIETKFGESIGDSSSTYDKFDNYDMYLFDVESSTLYYFHSNI